MELDSSGCNKLLNILILNFNNELIDIFFLNRSVPHVIAILKTFKQEFLHLL